MKSILLSFLAVTLVSTASFAQQKVMQKAVINTPGVQCQACKTRIENYLKHEYGVSSVRADYHHHTVTVSWYTDRTNIENIKTAIANLGYDADDVTRDPDAYKRLPITCQHMTPHPGTPPKKN
ncbi:MAG: heavy-metal-associated domain-containing protein [Bacteroidota bacterium]|nr:heavy-metal-associated domain-containing protein [Bacteroidota bacterium]